MILQYILIGLIGGIVSGAFGIGGGTIMVPAMVLFFGLSQHQAQGTALAVMLMPVFLFAVWRYHSSGYVQIKLACILAIGFTVGAFWGAHLIQNVPDQNLKKAFGIFLMLIGLKMAFLK